MAGANPGTFREPWSPVPVKIIEGDRLTIPSNKRFLLRMLT